jgi:hypothetical protein
MTIIFVIDTWIYFSPLKTHYPTESERYLQNSDFRLRTSHFEVQTSDFGIVIFRRGG